MLSFHGKNYVTDYKPHYGFQEEWQEKKDSELPDLELAIANSRVYELLFIVLYLVLLASTFVTSLDYFFKKAGPRDFYTATYCLTILALLLNVVRRVHAYLTTCQEQAGHDRWKLASEVSL